MNQQAETMSVERAEALAREDFELIQAAARNALMASMTLGESWGMILVDGSMYSPSWRALDGGAAVWESYDYPATNTTDVQDAYVETLDKLTDDWSGPNDEYLFWDEGCLFVGIGEQED